MNEQRRGVQHECVTAMYAVTTLVVTPLMPQSFRTRWTLPLIALGVAIWAMLWLFQDTTSAPSLRGTRGWGRWMVAAAIAALAAWPRIASWLDCRLQPLRNPSADARRRIAILITCLATAYLILTAHLQGRELFPKTHDDQSYLLQMRMLSIGRLWMPAHPLADFFDTFYVLSHPVYASLYFPGASLMYLPTIWLGLPTWFLPACVAGAIVGLVYRIFSELLDGVGGLLAALVMLSLEWFRVYSVLLTSHEPMLLLGLLLFWACLRWRRAEEQRKWKWALAMGVFAGWGAVTRPADALCFAIPIGLLLLGKAGSAAVTNRRIAGALQFPHPASFAALFIGAAPFLTLQLVFNHGVTGSLWKTPYALYLEQDQPNTSFGFHAYDAAARPISNLSQKQSYYDGFFAPYIVRHQPETVLSWWGRVYLPQSADTTLPGRFAIVFLPVGLLGLRDRRRLAMALILPLFFALYLFNTFFLEHYAILIAPAVLLLLLLGIRQVACHWPAHSVSIRVGVNAGLAAMALCTLPELNPLWADEVASRDETFSSPRLGAVQLLRDKPESLGHTPAVVLFTYRFGDNVQEEPVYNTASAWPDDAPVVFAHDLGARNREIFTYYAKTQPTRFFYRWDRATGQIEDLGFASALAISEK